MFYERRKVSAGYGHSCCCTTEGELYTWGSNRDGCLGLPRSTKFANSPQVGTDKKKDPKTATKTKTNAEERAAFETINTPIPPCRKNPAGTEETCSSWAW